MIPELTKAILKNAVLGLIFAAPLSAQFVAGQVVDPSGTGIVGVALLFNKGVTPTGAVSGIGGFFNVAVPANRYDITFNPPGTTVAPKFLQSISVFGPTNLGVITLDPGFLITGIAVTSEQVPVVGANIDVFDRLTNNLLFTPGDGTDQTGFFDVVVPAGSYIVRVKPPVTAQLVSRDIEPVNVGALTPMGTIILPDGFNLTGVVVDSQSLAPLRNVDLDADNSLTGKRLLTLHDKTDSIGQFSIVLPKGRFIISFDPPRGSRHVSRRLLDIVITGPRDLGTVPLQQGFLLSGTVLDQGFAPVLASDIDLLSVPGGVNLPLSNDKSDANGNYTIAALPGRYIVRAQPRVASRLLTAVTGFIDVTRDMTVPDFRLAAGVLLSGTLLGFDGQPADRADLDLIDPISGIKVLLNNDKTNSAGRYSLIVPTGIWNVRFQTKKASPSRTTVLPERSISADGVINLQLPPVPIFVYLSKPAFVTAVPNGSFIPMVVGIANLTKGIVGSTVSLLLIDPTGVATPLFPPTFLFIPNEDDAPADPKLISESIEMHLFFARLPPVNPSLLGSPFRLELRLDDPETGEEFDRDSFKVIIQ